MPAMGDGENEPRMNAGQRGSERKRPIDLWELFSLPDSSRLSPSMVHDRPRRLQATGSRQEILKDPFERFSVQVGKPVSLIADLPQVFTLMDFSVKIVFPISIRDIDAA